MDAMNQVHHTDQRTRPFWLKASVIGLIVEKLIQHLVVSLAFVFDWGAIRSSVAVSPRLLLLLGVIVALCFALTLWGIRRHTRWAIPLVVALALFDIIGEFIAQGTVGIVITVSFITAVLLLVLALVWLGADRRG